MSIVLNLEYRVDVGVDYRCTGGLGGDLVDDDVGAYEISGEVSA